MTTAPEQALKLSTPEKLAAWLIQYGKEGYNLSTPPEHLLDPVELVKAWGENRSLELNDTLRNHLLRIVNAEKIIKKSEEASFSWTLNWEFEPEMHPLSDYMSGISENCWCAVWIGGLEYELWSATIHGPRSFGQFEITQKDINTLKALSLQYNCWIKWVDSLGPVPIQLEPWKEAYFLSLDA